MKLLNKVKLELRYLENSRLICIVKTEKACFKMNTKGGLNNIHLFLIVPEGRKSNIQILVDLVPGEHLLSGIQTTTFMLCPYRTKTERQSVCPGLSSSSYKDTKARMKVPP